MKNLWIAGFEKRESKDRDKFGRVSFLNIYINRYKSYIPLMKCILPLVTIVTFVNVAINLFLYLTSGSDNNLVIMAIWLLAGFLWLFNTLLHYKVYFGYIEDKLYEWEKEKESLDQINWLLEE
jgi:hypothetical protein